MCESDKETDPSGDGVGCGQAHPDNDPGSFAWQATSVCVQKPRKCSRCQREPKIELGAFLRRAQAHRGMAAGSQLGGSGIQDLPHLSQQAIRRERLLKEVSAAFKDTVMDDGLVRIARRIEDPDLWP